MRVFEGSAADLCYKHFGSERMTEWSPEYHAMQQRMAEDFEHRWGPDGGPSRLGQPAPTNAGPRPWTPTIPPAEVMWMQQLRSAHTARFQQELLATLATRPPGRRIRYLRVVLGWSQRTAARQLGISQRTLIRHEQGHHRTQSARASLLARVGMLELAHANEILAYVARRREHASL